MNGVSDEHDDGGGNADAAAVPWSTPSVLLATCGGVGRIPFAPGTAGALVGIPLALATGVVSRRLAASAGAPLAGAAVEACLVAAVCIGGVPICSRAAARLGRGKDPGAVVYDEMAALPLVLLPVPTAARSVACLAVAFALFRVFDIAKPFPCRQLERLPAGWGIMADDWAAAAWAAACLILARSLGIV